MAILVPGCGYQSQRLPARYSWYLIFFGDIDVASAPCMKILVPHVGYRLRGLPASMMQFQLVCASARHVVSLSCMPTFVATVGN